MSGEEEAAEGGAPSGASREHLEAEAVAGPRQRALACGGDQPQLALISRQAMPLFAATLQNINSFFTIYKEQCLLIDNVLYVLTGYQLFVIERINLIAVEIMRNMMIQVVETADVY